MHVSTQNSSGVYPLFGDRSRVNMSVPCKLGVYSYSHVFFSACNCPWVEYSDLMISLVPYAHLSWLNDSNHFFVWCRQRLIKVNHSPHLCKHHKHVLLKNIRNMLFVELNISTIIMEQITEKASK